ncbi:hypothetical protein QJQ45_025205 [Haematococcus lacustris]|nr:hypothetical protein QJQ45_025205 [Haematococcus lacustris]
MALPFVSPPILVLNAERRVEGNAQGAEVLWKFITLGADASAPSLADVKRRLQNAEARVRSQEHAQLAAIHAPRKSSATTVAGMPRSSGLLSSERFWLADSGACHHITPDLNLMHDFQVVEQPSSRKQKALRSDNGMEYINQEHMRSELEGKAVQGVQVGYELGSKAYRVLVPGGKIIVTKDVVFDELARGAPLPMSEVAGAMATAKELSVHTPAAEPGPEPAEGVRVGKQWELAAKELTAQLTTQPQQVGMGQVLQLLSQRDGVPAWPPDNRLVFSVKEDSHGHIARFKARLVVKGFMQREGVDFTELHAPVTKHATVRALLATAAVWYMDLEHLDVKTAFG